jgi:hypothetical protein
MEPKRVYYFYIIFTSFQAHTNTHTFAFFSRSSLHVHDILRHHKWNRVKAILNFRDSCLICFVHIDLAALIFLQIALKPTHHLTGESLACAFYFYNPSLMQNSMKPSFFYALSNIYAIYFFL